MPYDTSADSYISRINDLLSRNDEASLLYAALELRCGVEVRMREYLEPLDHVPNARKKDYSITNLGKTVDSAFKKKEQVAVFNIFFPDGQSEVCLRYIPVPQRLRDIAARAGDALHFPGGKKAQDPIWWQRLRANVEEGSRWFAWVATGNLIGMPLLNPKVKQTTLRIYILDKDPRSAAFERLARKGEKHLIHIAYEPVPDKPPSA